MTQDFDSLFYRDEGSRKAKPRPRSEAEIQDEIASWLNNNGWTCLRQNSGGFRTQGSGFLHSYYVYGREGSARTSGWPDLQAIRGIGDDLSITVLLEVKSKAGSLTASQEGMIAWLNGRKTRVYCVRSLEEVKEIVGQVLKKISVLTNGATTISEEVKT